MNYDLFPTVGVRFCVKMARTSGSSNSRFFQFWVRGVGVTVLIFCPFVEGRARFCLSFGLVLVDKFVRSACSFYFREPVCLTVGGCFV